MNAIPGVLSEAWIDVILDTVMSFGPLTRTCIWPFSPEPNKMIRIVVPRRIVPPVLVAAWRAVAAFDPRSSALGAGEATGEATVISMPVALKVWLTSTGTGTFSCTGAIGAAVGAGLLVDCPLFEGVGAGELPLVPPQEARNRDNKSTEPRRHTRIDNPPSC